MEDEATMLEINLVLLLVAHLDEAFAAHKFYKKDAPQVWKTSTIKVLCDANANLAPFLQPYLIEREEEEDNSPKLAAEPLVYWFQQIHSLDEKEAAKESRLRSNAMRNLVSILVNNGGPEVYDARVRVALKQTARELGLDWKMDIAPFENLLFSTKLSNELSGMSKREDRERANFSASSSSSSAWDPFRVAKVVTAGVLGGTIVGLTGGAAAPVLAPVFATLFATSTAVMSVGLISSMFGIMGAGLASYKMTHRTDQSLSEFDFIDCNPSAGESVASSPTAAAACVTVLVGVSGCYPVTEGGVTLYLKQFWSREVEEGRFGGSNVFALLYETEAIANYSYTITEMLRDQAIKYTSGELLKFVVGQTVMLPISMMRNLDVINNSFVVCENKSFAAGNELAEVLFARYQGMRPVTLCGFGFGALLIFHCLERLQVLGGEGIVENVVLACCPLRARTARWEKAQSIVAGKIYNCYCVADWTLHLAMRAGISLGTIAGVAPVTDVPGVENVQIDSTHFKLGTDGGEEMAKLLLVLDL